MARNHAFCNEICDAVNITHTRCNYTKVTKTKRLLRTYASFKFNTEDETQIKFLMKLYELKTGLKRTYWTVALREEIRDLFGGHDTFLICPQLRQKLTRLIAEDNTSEVLHAATAQPQTPQQPLIPTARIPQQLPNTFATPVSPTNDEVDEPRAQRLSPRLLGLQPSPLVDNLSVSRLGFRQKFVTEFNCSVDLNIKGNYKKISEVKNRTFVDRANKALTYILKAAGYNSLTSPSDLKGNKDMYREVQMMIDAAKERLCRLTELTDEAVFGDDDNPPEEADDAYEEAILAEEESLKKEAVRSLEEKLCSKLSGPDYNDVRKQIKECTSLQLDTKYKLFKPIDSLIESIKIENPEYDTNFDNEISPDGPYDEASILQLNSVYEEGKAKDKKGVSLTKHIEETARKKKSTYTVLSFRSKNVTIPMSWVLE